VNSPQTCQPFYPARIHRGQAVLQTGELLRLRIQFTLGRRHPGGQPGDSALLSLLTDRRIRDGQIAAEFRQLLRLVVIAPSAAVTRVFI
jgi:hypothetical protein